MCNDSSQTLDAEHEGKDPKGQNKETDVQGKIGAFQLLKMKLMLTGNSILHFV